MKRKTNTKRFADLLNVRTKRGLPYMTAIILHPKTIDLIGTYSDEFKSNYDKFVDYLESVGLLSDV